MQFTLSRFNISNRALLILGVALLLLIVTHPVLASNTSGGGLPSDEWFTKLRQSVTGPWAFTFAIVGIVGAGATLIFGGDLNGFLRTIIFLVLVLSFIVAAQNTLAAITGQGAEIAALSNTLAEHLQARLA
ncbi:MAG: TrbC/VirB2 family protein [Burkholderiaceae bacterium]